MISYYYFGISISFSVSVIFSIFLIVKILQSLEDRNLLSAISILGPILYNIANQVLLNKLDHSELINSINIFLSKYQIKYNVTNSDINSIIVYIVLLFVVLIIDSTDNTAIGKHLPSDDPEFKRKSFREQNDSFCKTLSQRIERINTSLQWNDSLYIPIAAEVEMTKGKEIKRYDDMLKCLKTNRQGHPLIINSVRRIKYSCAGKNRVINRILISLEKRFDKKNVYLVLGDPGSGKSVSLRKLCYDLLKESQITGKTPVYISLKTWTSKGREWNENNLPTTRDLIQYIREELYKDGDLLTDEFLDHYFEKMLKDGRWYFIFDSFDEMPCLMGNNKNSVLIKHISGLLFEFLSGPNQSGGVIASRIYNRPSDSLRQTCTLTLKSFNDARIRNMIRKYINTDVNETIKKLFRDRNDLVGLCRNPFHLALLINYIKKQQMALPNNQFELFKDFIDERLQKSKIQIEKSGLSIEKIYAATIDLSILMQNDGGYGLDFPVERIYDATGEEKLWEKYLAILEYIRICRRGGNNQTISFVHRRFQEFFFVEGIILGKVSINESDCSGILHNTGIRDSLVLYCQIGDEKEVLRIAEFCCDAIESNLSKISNILNEGCVELVNSLYFLTEAFSNRKTVLHNNIELISGLRKYLTNTTDYIILLAIVNSMSLLNKDDIELTMLDTFKLHNRWLNSTLVSNCQVVQKLSKKTEMEFCQYFDSLNYKLIEKFLSVDFSLSLSDGFKYIRIMHALLLCRYIIIGICVAWVVLLTVAPSALFIIKKTISLLYILKRHGFKIMVEQLSLGMASSSVNTVTGSLKPVSGSVKISFLLINVLLFPITITMQLISFYRSIYMDLYEDSVKEVSENTSRRSSLEYTKKIRKKTIGHKPTYNPFISNPYISDFYSMALKAYSVFFIFKIITSIHSRFEEVVAIFIFSALLFINLYQLSHEVIWPFITYTKANGFNSLLEIVLETSERLKKACIHFIRVLWKNLWFLVTLMIQLSLSAGLGIALLYAIAFLVCYLNKIETSKQNIKCVMAIVLFLLLVGFLCFRVLFLTISYLKDYIWLTRQRYNRIDRESFVYNVRKIKTKTIRRRYVKEMIKNEVILEGQWPDGRRLLLSDDVFNRDLALWDCKERSIDNYFTTGM